VAQLLTLHPERFLTATQAGGAGRSPKAANDPRILVEAGEIENGCISRSRLYRQAPPRQRRNAVPIQTSTNMPLLLPCEATTIRLLPQSKCRPSGYRRSELLAHSITR
jgi:hypothetical protein